METDLTTFENFKNDVQLIATRSNLQSKTKLDSDLQVAELLKTKMIDLRTLTKDQKSKIEDLEEELKVKAMQAVGLKLITDQFGRYELDLDTATAEKIEEAANLLIELLER